MHNELSFLDANPEQQIKELERELETRRRVYPRWIREGKLSEKDAQFRIASMEASVFALRDYYGQRRDGFGISSDRAALALKSVLKLKKEWAYISSRLIQNGIWNNADSKFGTEGLDIVVGFLRNVKYGTAVAARKCVQGNLFDK